MHSQTCLSHEPPTRYMANINGWRTDSPWARMGQDGRIAKSLEGQKTKEVGKYTHCRYHRSPGCSKVSRRVKDELPLKKQGIRARGCWFGPKGFVEAIITPGQSDWSRSRDGWGGWGGSHRHRNRRWNHRDHPRWTSHCRGYSVLVTPSTLSLPFSSDTWRWSPVVRLEFWLRTKIRSPQGRQHCRDGWLDGMHGLEGLTGSDNDLEIGEENVEKVMEDRYIENMFSLAQKVWPIVWPCYGLGFP